MYAVVKENRSANKFFIKTRRIPLSNKFDSFDNSIKKDAETLQAKDTGSNALMRNLMKNRSQSQISSQHEEMARYISSSWIGIKQELEEQSNEQLSSSSTSSNSRNNKSSSGKIHYLNSSSTPKNFVPFDLESFWREKILQNLLGSA